MEHTTGKSMRGYSCIGLHNPKNPLNVGSALRASGCYGVSMVAIGGQRPDRYMHRMPTDTQKAYRHIPVIRTEDLHSVIPYDCIPIAVDLIDGAKSLIEFQHPERAFYVFGPEDGTLGHQVTRWCKHIIYVPTKYCMNLAATINVVLYDRLIKV